MARILLSLCIAFGVVATYSIAASAETVHVTSTRTGPKGEVHFERTRTCSNGTCTVTGKETDSKGHTRTFTSTRTR